MHVLAAFELYKPIAVVVGGEPVVLPPFVLVDTPEQVAGNSDIKL
jgi:hypothetical protein